MKLIRFDSKNFNSNSSDYLEERIKSHLVYKEKINIALPGGNTPLPILRDLVNKNIQWKNISFFQTDERLVSLNQVKSNFKNLTEVFFCKINASTYPMYIGEYSAKKSLDSYTNILKKINRIGDFPCFNIVVLGMGEDGHIASIFPGSSLLNEKKKTVMIDPVKRNGTFRMTLTLPTLINSTEIILLISGNDKLKLLESKKARINLPIDYLIHESLNLTVLCTENL